MNQLADQKKINDRFWQSMDHLEQNCQIKAGSASQMGEFVSLLCYI